MPLTTNLAKSIRSTLRVSQASSASLRLLGIPQTWLLHRSAGWQRDHRRWKAKIAAAKTEYRCTAAQCEYCSPRSFGRCPRCGTFGSAVEVQVQSKSAVAARQGGGAAMLALEKAKERDGTVFQPAGHDDYWGSLQRGSWVSSDGSQPKTLSNLVAQGKGSSFRMPLPGPAGEEVTRVLGGGVVPGSMTLIGGDPGVGKSTLLLQLAGWLASPEVDTEMQANAKSQRRKASPNGAPLDAPDSSQVVLYVSGEESEEQVADRASRLNVRNADRIQVMRENDVEKVLQHLSQSKPKAVILDSIQTVFLATATGAVGSIAQVKECATAMMMWCKSAGVAGFLIGHVTKGGDLAGPKMLEHLVDTVLYLEGEDQSSCRILRTTKNRFGSTDEVGIFSMTGGGLEPLVDAGQFLQQRQGAEGRGTACVTAVVLEGNRPLLIEVQALCSAVSKDRPPVRMTTGGLDFRRFDLVLAVLSKHARLRLWDQDARINVVGAVNSKDPAADAAVAAAIISSFCEVDVPVDMAFVGEVGLGGEFRKVKMLDKRLTEATKLGFSRVVIPAGSQISKKHEQCVVRCSNVRHLMQLLGAKPVTRSTSEDEAM